MQNYKNFLLTGLLIFAPLAIGAIHPWSIAICLLVSAILFAIEVFERGAGKPDLRPGAVGWIVIGLCIFTMIQLVPLPSQLVRFLSPRSAEVKLSLFESLIRGEAPTLLSLTLDQFSTLRDLMKLAGGALLFLAVRHRVRKEGSSGVLWCVAWSGVAVSLVFFIHRLAGWERVYEFYKPLYASTTPLSAPLLNPNHLAGHLGVTAAVSVGLAFSERERVKRLLLIFAAGFTGGAVLLTLSRGGILSFIGGQILFVTLRLVVRSSSKEGSRRIGQETKLLPVALAVGLAAGIYVAYRSILGEFLYGDIAKLKIPADAIPMIKDFWVTGVGKGAFQVGYTFYQKLPDLVTYTSPENFVVLWLSECGGVAGSAWILTIAAVLLLGLFRPPLRGRNAGALAALFGIMVQNFVDFSLELLGVLLPFMVLLASEVVRLERAYGSRQPSSSNKKSHIFCRGRLPSAIGIGATATAVALAATGWYLVGRYSLESETAKIKNGLALNLPWSKLREDLEGAMKRHPADYYFPLAAGVKAYHDGDRNPLPYLARALSLFPRSAVAHLYIARTIGRSGFRTQALLEYMEALRSRPTLAPTVAAEIVRLAGDLRSASAAVRSDEDRLLLFDALSVAFLQAGLPAESAATDDAILVTDRCAAGALGRKTRRLLEAGKLEDASALVSAATDCSKLGGLILTLKGEIEEKKGNKETAASLFIAAWEQDKGLWGHLGRAARLYADLGNTKKMYRLLSQMEAASPDERSRGYAILQKAALELELGRLDASLASYQTAAAYLPDDPAPWQAVARLAAEKNDTALELKAYNELARIEPDNPTWKQKIEEIRSRLNSSALIGELPGK